MKTKLSNIIAGTMTWGEWGKKMNSKSMTEFMMTCLESQITTFDHADIYGGHTTEEDFGKALAQSTIDRSTIQLVSKCGIKYQSDRRTYAIKHYDYSTEYIIWSVENSLKNLQSDYLDVLLLHRPSPLMHADEIAKAIAQLKQQGKIIDFGVSNFTPSQTALLQEKIKIDCNQIQFSPTHCQAMTDGSLDYMQVHKIIPMAWNPLGDLYKEPTEQTKRLHLLLDALSQKYDLEKDQLALAWILKHPSGILPVIGTTHLERIKKTPEILTCQMELEDWFAIWTESMGQKVP